MPVALSTNSKSDLLFAWGCVIETSPEMVKMAVASLQFEECASDLLAMVDTLSMHWLATASQPPSWWFLTTALASQVWVWTRFRTVHRSFACPEPRTRHVVQFCPGAEPWTELRSGSEKFRSELRFGTGLWYPYMCQIWILSRSVFHGSSIIFIGRVPCFRT